MNRQLRDAVALMALEFRRKLPLIAVAALSVSLLEALGLGLVFPVAAVIVNPERAVAHPLLAEIYQRSGAETPNVFLAYMGIGLVLVFVTKNIASALLSRWQQDVILDAEADLAHRVFRAYLTAPYENLSNKNSSELTRELVNSIPLAFGSFLIPAISAATELAILVFGVAAVVLVDPITALVVFAIIVVAGGAIYRQNRRRLVVVGERMNGLYFVILNQIKQALGAAKELRILGRTNNLIDEYARNRSEMGKFRLESMYLSVLPRYILESILAVAIFAVAAWAFHKRPPEEAVAVLGLFAAAGMRLVPSANRIIVAIQQMRVGAPAVSKLTHDLAEFAKTSTHVAAPPSLDTPEGITFNHVTYAYPNQADAAVRDISFRIPWGHSVGLVGESGAGKTTFADLLLGLLAPKSGIIRINGQDLLSMPEEWQRQVGYVPQSIYLTDESIRRNIALGVTDEDIDDAAVRRAIERANLSDLIRDLPEGMETMVGEQGVRLSGGQRQRIGIARALYHDPQILVMDEATAALDNETESRVAEAIEQFRGSKTMIIIAHRLSTVRHCDQIVLFRNGIIDATGSFDDLCKSNPHFARMVELGKLK